MKKYQQFVLLFVLFNVTNSKRFQLKTIGVSVLRIVKHFRFDHNNFDEKIDLRFRCCMERFYCNELVEIMDFLFHLKITIFNEPTDQITPESYLFSSNFCSFKLNFWKLCVIIMTNLYVSTVTVNGLLSDLFFRFKCIIMMT